MEHDRGIHAQGAQRPHSIVGPKSLGSDRSKRSPSLKENKEKLKVLHQRAQELFKKGGEKESPFGITRDFAGVTRETGGGMQWILKVS